MQVLASLRTGRCGAHTESHPGVVSTQIDEFLRSRAPEPITRDAAAPGSWPLRETSERVFDLLTDRAFCYLSKSRVARYRDAALASFEKDVGGGAPIHFYYDLGGGYHASLRPGVDALNFDVGLGEWFALAQIARFARDVRAVYPPSVRFHIVIDNLCALTVNNIELPSTEAYCARLRQLIRALKLDGMIDLLVESEHLSPADYREQALAEDAPAVVAPPSPEQIENVERFLGRRCSTEETRERIRLYTCTGRVSDRLLALLIDRIRLTQRATPSTLCFRPFPGADCRIQTGQVVLTLNGKRQVCPMLLTSRNFADYALSEYRFPEVLPAQIGSVMFAESVEKGS